jgi:hypothetical protein
VSGFDTYKELVHELTRLDADAAAGAERAQREMAQRRESLDALRAELDEEVASLAEGCAALRSAVPDLAPEPAAEEGDFEATVRDGRLGLRDAVDARTAAMRSGQRPTFMPGVHHVLRELVIYGSCMAVCLGGQLAWLAASGGGESLWWVTFLPPVLATLVGYVLVGAANKPRLPMLDRSGKPIKPVVPHNPRLGVTLAVATMALFAYFAFWA